MIAPISPYYLLVFTVYIGLSVPIPLHRIIGVAMISIYAFVWNRWYRHDYAKAFV